ncbi:MULTISPECIES: acyl-CoA dehydrogenase family protein [unclassified Roseiflexus]|jgi:alkylation response protein AidB-like acyl-CoA dehydrogenase|uniref:acyl-CoA dehydrogenase family protein n=1 Tax=unclassified Roseiflexus TaxID=2609473 RepID=UPI0000D7FF59|nr:MULTISPECIES: acyl-CoA dehydrogenase family protein [unclassified Roseiflexus]ABQ88751.1 acyl-CoA dehydrogenase domain protein [Roseiflexus sp. RS-1]MBO9322100.1 acyl-CoA dehydrogenase family protein [Roseiflexus sp.]MCL6540914.1 acyl-CoA dehydrogenase family protein [Roseiflexus sp.]
MNFDLTPEHQRIRAEVRRFAEQEIAPRARHVDETGEFPAATLRKMAELGLMGLPFPEEYGGAGADSISTAIAIEEVARACGSTALIYSAHLGLGCAPIAMFGTEEQKRRFLRPAAEGRHLGAFALTEPHAGSDAGATRTTARLENGEWVINGAKMWITSASVAGHLIVTAVTDPGERHSISAIIVPAGTPGLSFGKPEAKMGLRGSITNAVTFEDVRVPEENLLGRRGRGLQQFLAVLDGGRIGIGAMAIGLAQAAFEIASAYARERTAFGKLIGAYESVSNMIADMAVGLEAARLLVYQAAWLKDQGRQYSREAAIAKLYASEVGEKICRDAIQVLGGYGYSSEYPLERIYRDQRLLTIGEGTSEILRVVIARQILGEFVGR